MKKLLVALLALSSSLGPVSAAFAEESVGARPAGVQLAQYYPDSDRDRELRRERERERERYREQEGYPPPRCRTVMVKNSGVWHPETQCF